jgi:hypothetical protein
MVTLVNISEVIWAQISASCDDRRYRALGPVNVAVVIQCWMNLRATKDQAIAAMEEPALGMPGAERQGGNGRVNLEGG